MNELIYPLKLEKVILKTACSPYFLEYKISSVLLNFITLIKSNKYNAFRVSKSINKSKGITLNYKIPSFNISYLHTRKYKNNKPWKRILPVYNS